MTAPFRKISRITGIMLTVIGLAMIPPLIVALVYGEHSSALWFGITAACCVVPGLILTKALGPAAEDIKFRQRDGFLAVALAWLIASIAGTVPIYATGSIPDIASAFFESCSGFTTTGATVVSDIEALPLSISFFRSFAQWLGGMGIIVLATALIPELGIEGQVIASAESPSPRLDKITSRYSETARRLYLVYIAFTVILFVIMLALGLGVYDALCTTLSTVSTGGFSPYTDNIGHFTSPVVRIVMIVFMILCATNFNLFFEVKKRGPRVLLHDTEFKFYIIFLVVVSSAIAIDLIVTKTVAGTSDAIEQSAFHSVSIMTTSGFTTDNYDNWPTFAKMMLLLLCLTGGSSSSTSCGVKVIRIVIALKLIRRSISLRLHPGRVYPLKINGAPMPKELADETVYFILLYILTFFVGSLFVSFSGCNMITSLSASLSCIGNIGPGFSGIGPAYSYGSFGAVTKIILSLMMIAGRLELFTFFMVFSPHYWNGSRS